MADAEGVVLPCRAWLEAFLTHVARKDPDAALPLVASVAAKLYVRLGQFDPVDVAEAEWDGLPLRERRRVARVEPSEKCAVRFEITVSDLDGFPPFAELSAAKADAAEASRGERGHGQAR